MNVTMEKTDAVSARLTVTVNEADYQPEVEKELKKLGRTQQIPGFRKGHVPFGELKRRFGKEMTSEVLNRKVYDAVTGYLRENKIDILGEPMPVEIKELDLVNQKDFTFEYDLALAPELNAEINKDVHVPFYKIEVTDEMVKEQSDAFRRRFGSQQPGEEFEENAVVKGVFMELDSEGKIKEGDDSIQVADGIVGPIHFKSKEEADKFIGKKVGETVVFNPYASCDGDVVELSSMLHIDRERAAEVKNDFQFTISEIIVLRPAEINEEFINNVFGTDSDIKTEEEYLAAVKDVVAQNLLSNSRALFAQTVKKEFVDRFGGFELPERLLKQWLIRRNEGLNEENIDEEFKKLERDLRWQLISDRVAKQLNVEVTEEDLLEFAKIIASRQFAQYGMTNIPMETIEQYAKTIVDDKKYRSQLYDQTYESKLFAAIDDAVTLDTEEVSLVKFREIAQNL